MCRVLDNIISDKKYEDHNMYQEETLQHIFELYMLYSKMNMGKPWNRINGAKKL